MELESDPESDADEAGATPAAAKAARGPAPSSGLPANWQEMWGGTGLGRARGSRLLDVDDGSAGLEMGDQGAASALAALQGWGQRSNGEHERALVID